MLFRMVSGPVTGDLVADIHTLVRKFGGNPSCMQFPRGSVSVPADAKAVELNLGAPTSLSEPEKHAICVPKQRLGYATPYSYKDLLTRCTVLLESAYSLALDAPGPPSPSFSIDLPAECMQRCTVNSVTYIRAR